MIKENGDYELTVCMWVDSAAVPLDWPGPWESDGRTCRDAAVASARTAEWKATGNDVFGLIARQKLSWREPAI